MSQAATLFWGIVVVGGITVLATLGSLLVRHWVAVEILEPHNEVAGSIYSVIGVMYAVLLGFTAIIVWERYDNAQTAVETEANELGDLYRDAQVFPEEVRKDLETKIRSYIRLVVEKEWPSMAEDKSSPETADAFNQLRQTYRRFTPQTEQERIWYTQSLTSLNQLIDQRRLRVLSSQSTGIPKVMWAVLLGAGAVTLSFSFLFGTRNTAAQLLMTAGLAITISLVLFSVVALERPFAGIARIEPDAFNQLTIMLDRWSPR
jgi:uncharacterized protein DUF4239